MNTHGEEEAVELGLNVDMTDVARLNEWARCIETFGNDLTHWSSPAFVVKWLRDLAERLDKEVRDVGALRRLVAIGESSGELPRRISDFLSAGGLFNPGETAATNPDALRNLLFDCRSALLAATGAAPSTEPCHTGDDERIDTLGDIIGSLEQMRDDPAETDHTFDSVIAECEALQEKLVATLAATGAAAEKETK